MSEVEGLRAALAEIARQDDIELALDPTWPKRVAREALAALAPAEGMGDGWLPIESAPKDGTPILVRFRPDLATLRADLSRWAGVYAVLKHQGLASDGFDIGWSVAAPVGHGGFPDDCLSGWRPLPAAPTTTRED